MDALTVFARAGYASRGLVYLIVGGFAVFAALGQTGEAVGTKGALLKLLNSTGGTFLLLAVAAGLFCYAAWRAVQSLADADNHGTDARGLAVRAGLAVSAVAHLLLALWAVGTVMGVAGSGEEGGGISKALMGTGWGQLAVMVAGAWIVCAGIAHIHKGFTAGYEKWLDASEREMKFIRPVSAVGLIARGIVFLVIGGLLIYAGNVVDPAQAAGLPAAIRWMRSLPFGGAIVFSIAVGLVCFGAYSILESVYRRIGGPRTLS